MRIGLVTPGFSASESDWCIPAHLDLVRALARDHDVYVLALRYPHACGRYQVHGADVEALGGAGCRRLARVRLLGRAVVTLCREAKRRRLQVLHALWAHEPGCVATLAGRYLGLPSVVTILGGELVGLHDLDYGGQLTLVNRRLIRTALWGADIVTVGSSETGALAARYVESRRLRLAPFGVDDERFGPTTDGAGPTLAGRPRILTVASLVPVKDQGTLLEAIAMAGDGLSQAHVHLVGEGASESHLRQLVQRLELGRRVTFHGAIPHDRLPGYYHAADVCVLPSRFDCQPMVILEAAACGRRTIGTPVGLLREVSGEGAMVMPANPRALADLLVAQLTAPLPLRPRLTRDEIVTRYGLRAATDGLVELYRTLVDDGRA